MALSDTFLKHNFSQDMTGNGGTESVDDIPSPLVHDVTLTFFILAFIMVAVGVVANSMIIISGWRLPLIRKKSVTSGSRYYIMNLAMADLGVLVVASVTNLVSMRYSWDLGTFMCKVLLPLRDVFVLVSLGTITVLSVERYWLITRPLHHIPNKNAAKFVIFGIWLLSYIVHGIPLLLITRLEDNGNVKSCAYKWPSVKVMKAHVCFGISILLATFIIVTFCYIAIGIALKKIYRKRVTTTQGEYDMTGHKHSVNLIIRSKRLVKMLIVIVVTFTICTLPAISYVMAVVFYNVRFKNQEVLYVFFNSMMISGSALNPIILLIMASEYGTCIRECKQLLTKWKDHCFSCFEKEPVDQQYHGILQDKNQPSTPV